MSQLTVTVNSKSYSIACDDGQEEHLRKLGGFVNERVVELASAMGQVGEARLLLMASLTVADELSDALAEVERLKKDLSDLQVKVSENQSEEVCKEILSKTIERMESLTDSLRLADRDDDEQVFESNLIETQSDQQGIQSSSHGELKL